MLCFGFNSARLDPVNASGCLSVELCEEVIKYRTRRDEGISVAGNLVVRSSGEGRKYLGVWHRADVSPIKIDQTADWLNPTSFLTALFCNLAEGRGAPSHGRTVEMKLFEERDDGVALCEQAQPVAVPELAEGSCPLTASSPVEEDLANQGLSAPDSEAVPYTYAEIGPFEGEDKLYAVRISARIGEPSFGRLVTEIPTDGTRVYDVYGADEIARKIERLDLPRLQMNAKETVFGVYQRCFEHTMQAHRLSPQYYSVVAIDAPDSDQYDPPKMYAVKLTRCLRDLTDEIPDDAFGSPELSALQGRVFWFVSSPAASGFRLELEGPMAEVSHRLARH